MGITRAGVGIQKDIQSAGKRHETILMKMLSPPTERGKNSIKAL